MGPRPSRAPSPDPNPWWKHSHFNFKVSERPKYVPGSGPPLAPISLMPPHDKEGIILDLVKVSGSLRYLVGYKDSGSQVGVKPQKILDWVSSRTLEDWEFQQTNLREKQRLETELPIIEAKEARRRKKLETLAQKQQEKSRAKAFKTPRTRKRKHLIATREEGFSLRQPTSPVIGSFPSDPNHPAKRPRPSEDVSITSPRRRSVYEGQPSLSKPVLDIPEAIAVDTASEDDDVALERQLRETSDRSGFATPINLEPYSMSVSTSPDPLETPLAKHKPSRATSDIFYDAPFTPTLSPRAMSLTRSPKLAGGKNLRRTGETSNRTSGDEEMEEDEYDIKGILDHEWRQADDGSIERYFYIDWEGNWDPTWEPEANVGLQAIEEYEEARRNERMRGNEQSWQINNENG